MLNDKKPLAGSARKRLFIIVDFQAARLTGGMVYTFIVEQKRCVRDTVKIQNVSHVTGNIIMLG